MNENAQNSASVTNPAGHATDMREYTRVHFGDSIAYVPRKSKFYASLMRSLMNAALNCPGAADKRRDETTVFSAENLCISDGQMLLLVAMRYEQPSLPSQAAFIYRHGETAEKYCANIAKFRSRRRKLHPNAPQTPENQAT